MTAWRVRRVPRLAVAETDDDAAAKRLLTKTSLTVGVNACQKTTTMMEPRDSGVAKQYRIGKPKVRGP
jgi:hypothetical protein